MTKRSKRSSKLGLPPGSLVYVGKEESSPPTISQIIFGPDSIDERELSLTLAELQSPPLGQTTWINLDGVHDPITVKEIGSRFGLHALTMEDILTTDQRPKREDIGDYIFVVSKMLSLSQSGEIVSEQVSFALGRDFLLSFQERKHPGDVFTPVRERLRNDKGKIRHSKSDYLFYALLDAIVDHYYVILESIGERVEVLEAELIREPSQGMLSELYNLKRMSLTLRRSAWPLREVITSLLHDEHKLFDHSTLLYMRDLYSHIVQIIDNIEVMRETLASMLEIYLSSTSNKLNSVMKVLTLVTTIFMPLSLVAGIYGMNFDHMPELQWKYGYLFALGLMVAIAGSMVFLFWKKRWL